MSNLLNGRTDRFEQEKIKAQQFSFEFIRNLSLTRLGPHNDCCNNI